MISEPENSTIDILVRTAGNVTVEINPSETTVSHVVDYRLAMTAGAALDEIWKRYKAESAS